MLNSFRAFSDNLVTKLLLLMLIASFAMWGIGDMLGHTGSAHALVQVGADSISIDSYRRELGIESERVRQQLGANFSEELLRRLNVPQYVLRRMIQQSLLKQEAKHMGFIPDDTTVALEIRKSPVFASHSGMFDKARFETMLRNQGLSENAYIEQTRLQLATDKLLDALSVELPVSDAMLSTLQAAYNQGREITLYKLTPENFLTSATPSDAELEEFEKANPEPFTTTELRTVSFMRFSANDAKVAPKITDETVREYYQAHADQFHSPEKRDVEQLLYDSEDKAKSAYNQAKIGKKFSEIADSIPPLNRKTIALGFVEKKSLPEGAADTVFSLKPGGFTEPVKSPFGWHVFRVVSIEPEGTQSLEKVRAAVEAGIKQESGEHGLNDKMNQLEDALAGGSTLKEAAANMGMVVEQAGTFDREGHTADGTQNKTLPPLDKFVDVAFKTEEKTESSITTSRGGIYYVLRVDATTPAKLRPFAQAKADIVKAYKKHEGEKAMADAASRIESDVSKGKKAADVIASYKLTAAGSGSISRNSKSLSGEYLPPSFVTKIFSSDNGDLTAPMRDKDGNYLLARVGAMTPGNASDGVKLSKKELTQQMQEEMMMQYLRYLEMQYSVDIRQDMLDQLLQNSPDVTR